MKLLLKYRATPLLTSVVAVMPLLSVGVAAGVGSNPVKHGHYAGTVGPGWPISFSVSANGKTVEHLVAGFDPGCNGPAAETPTMFHFDALAIRNGKFSGHALDSFGKKVSESLRITGSFSGHTATGEVSDTSHIASLPNCTEKATFTTTAG